MSCHVGIAGGVHGDPEGEVGAGAPDIPAIHQRRASGIDLGHERVRAAVGRQVRPGGQWESRLGGFGVPGYVGVPPDVHSDGGYGVVRRASEKAAVDQERRIKDERQTGFIGPDFKAVGRLIWLCGAKPKGEMDRCSFAIYVLVGRRHIVAEPAERRRNLEAAVAIDRDAVRAPVGQPDLRGVGPGMDDELIFQAVGGAVICQVDAGPEAAIDDPRVGRKARLPLGGLPLEIGHYSAGFGLTDGPDIRVGADKIQLDGPAFGHLSPGISGKRRGLRQGQGHSVVREVDRLILTLDIIDDVFIELAPVGNEINGQVAEIRIDPDGRRQAGRRAGRQRTSSPGVLRTCRRFTRDRGQDQDQGNDDTRHGWFFHGAPPIESSRKPHS